MAGSRVIVKRLFKAVEPNIKSPNKMHSTVDASRSGKRFPVKVTFLERKGVQN